MSPCFLGAVAWLFMRKFPAASRTFAWLFTRLPDVNSSGHGPDSSADLLQMDEMEGRHDPLSAFSLGNVACLHVSKFTVATKPLAQPSL